MSPSFKCHKLEKGASREESVYHPSVLLIASEGESERSFGSSCLGCACTGLGAVAAKAQHFQLCVYSISSHIVAELISPRSHQPS